MSASLLLSVAAISWQNSRVFKLYLDKHLHERSLGEARDAANSAQVLLEGWITNIPFVMQGLTQSPGPEFRKGLAAFVNANREILSFEVLRESPDIQSLHFEQALAESDVRLETRQPSEIESKTRRATRRWVETLARKGPASRQFYLRNFERLLALPAIGIAMPFKSADRGTVHWAVVVIWSTRLLSALPSDAKIEGFLLDESGRIFLAHARGLSGTLPQLAGPDVLAAASTGSAASGLKTIRGENGRDTIAAFTRIPRFRLAVVTLRDAVDGHQAIERIVFKTALWGWIILLLAVLASYLAVGRVTKNLSQVIDATVRISSGDLEVRLPRVSEDEVGSLGEAVNHMAGQVKELFERKVQAARLEKELETARLVQETLLPRENIEAGSLAITGLCQPASECGGDWWGHFVTDDGQHCILLADATGHGVPAALVTALAHSCCNTLAASYRDPSVHKGSLVGMMAALNDLLWHTHHGQHRERASMTFLAAMIDTRTGVLKVASAGHTMPYILPASGEDERLHPAGAYRPRPVIVRCRGMPLGFAAELDLVEVTYKLREGDRLFLFTDGLIECTSPAGEAWSKQRLEAALLSHMTNKPEELRGAILGEAFRHFDGAVPDDDITVVVVEWRGAAGAAGGGVAA